MSPRLRRKRVLSLLAAALVAAAVGWAFQATHALRAVELVALDARFDLRGEQKPSPDVVVVAVDARTIAAGKGKLPIDRARDADVIGRLAEAGAGVIAYGVQFTEASDDPDADDALVQAVHDGTARPGSSAARTVSSSAERRRPT
jgi:CHASE2 domain-containing sensor protein